MNETSSGNGEGAAPRLPRVGVAERLAVLYKNAVRISLDDRGRTQAVAELRKAVEKFLFGQVFGFVAHVVGNEAMVEAWRVDGLVERHAPVNEIADQRGDGARDGVATGRSEHESRLTAREHERRRHRARGAADRKSTRLNSSHRL